MLNRQTTINNLHHMELCKKTSTTKPPKMEEKCNVTKLKSEMLCGTDLHSIRSFSVASPTKYLEFPNNIIRAAVESRGQNRIVVVREGGDGQFDNDSNILSIFSSYQSRHLAYLLKKKNTHTKQRQKKV